MADLFGSLSWPLFWYHVARVVLCFIQIVKQCQQHLVTSRILMEPFIKRDISKLCLNTMDKRETIIDRENSTILGIYGPHKTFFFFFISNYVFSFLNFEFLKAWQIGRNSTSCYRLQKIANYNSRILHIAILSMIGLGSNQSGLHHYCDRVEIIQIHTFTSITTIPPALLKHKK